MSVRVELVNGPVTQTEAASAGEAGAVVRFDGVVRLLEGDRAIRALRYEAYEPMATREMLALANDLVARFGLTSLDVWHSVGEVPVGACSFRLLIRAPHRREALDAMSEFIDRLKRDVPIWKTACWSDEVSRAT